MRFSWIWFLGFVLVACGKSNIYKASAPLSAADAVAQVRSDSNESSGSTVGAVSGPFRLLSMYGLRLAGPAQASCVQPQTYAEYQGWKFVDAGDGKVFIKNTNNNDMFCLSAAGTYAMVGGCQNAPTALWIKEQVNIESGSSNHFRFRTSPNGPCLKAVGFTSEVKIETGCDTNDSVWQAAPYY